MRTEIREGVRELETGLKRPESRRCKDQILFLFFVESFVEKREMFEELFVGDLNLQPCLYRLFREGVHYLESLSCWGGTGCDKIACDVVPVVAEGFKRGKFLCQIGVHSVLLGLVAQRCFIVESLFALTRRISRRRSRLKERSPQYGPSTLNAQPEAARIAVYWRGCATIGGRQGPQFWTHLSALQHGSSPDQVVGE